MEGSLLNTSNFLVDSSHEALISALLERIGVYKSSSLTDSGRKILIYTADIIDPAVAA